MFATHLLFAIQPIEMMSTEHKQTKKNLQLYYSFFLIISARGRLEKTFKTFHLGIVFK